MDASQDAVSVPADITPAIKILIRQAVSRPLAPVFPDGDGMGPYHRRYVTAGEHRRKAGFDALMLYHGNCQ